MPVGFEICNQQRDFFSEIWIKTKSAVQNAPTIETFVTMIVEGIILVQIDATAPGLTAWKAVPARLAARMAVQARVVNLAR